MARLQTLLTQSRFCLGKGLGLRRLWQVLQSTRERCLEQLPNLLELSASGVMRLALELLFVLDTGLAKQDQVAAG
jgi:hypothetical protein